MAPLTKAKAVRRSELFKISDEPDRKRGRPAKKVMPVQQEQILAEELNLKVLADDRPGVQKRRKSAAASEAPGIPKQMPQPEKLAERMASPPRGRGRPPKQQVVSVPPAIITARRNRKLRTAAFAVIVLVVCAVGGYIYTSHKPVEAVSNDSKLIQQVAAKAVLPTDESPSISTVVNATAVNQPFLKGAKNGDKVLLYFQAGRAIVFRPSTGQVVNMGALQEPQPKVFIRSGSPDADTSKIGAEIAASGDFDIASRDQSPVNNYTKTIVVDVAGNRPDIANQLANVLHATVAKLPDGESAPDADLLVIVGSDNPVK